MIYISEFNFVKPVWQTQNTKPESVQHRPDKFTFNRQKIQLH